MASPGNQHCANCIGTLLFPVQTDGGSRGCGGRGHNSAESKQQRAVSGAAAAAGSDGDATVVSGVTVYD